MVKRFLFQSISKHKGNAIMPHPFEAGSDALPRFRGVLMCRRCDSCGARIDLEREANDRVVLKCPRCHREYVFIERKE